jgi:hypothetical protein
LNRPKEAHSERPLVSVVFLAFTLFAIPVMLHRSPWLPQSLLKLALLLYESSQDTTESIASAFKVVMDNIPVAKVTKSSTEQTCELDKRTAWSADRPCE